MRKRGFSAETIGEDDIPREGGTLLEIRARSLGILGCDPAREFIGCVHRSGRWSPPEPGVPLNKEGDVKELSVEEVLRIAGGVPVSAALDELTYRAPTDPAGEPVDFAH